MSRRCIVAVLAVCACSAAVSAQDAVLDWNNVYLDSIRQAGGTPGSVSWSGAIVHTSMFDAANSFDRTYQPYTKYYTPPANGVPQMAAAGAAYESLVGLFPQYKTQYDAALQTSIARYGGGGDVTASIDFGRQVASDLLAKRQGAMADFNGTWPGGTQPGQWRPTPPDMSAAVGSNLGNQTPWVLTKPDQFPVPPPLAMKSAEYTAAYNEVKQKGALVNSTRTAYETQTASFWANDINGTYKPSGQLNSIAQEVSRDRGLSFKENARLFALLNLSMADSAVSCWNAKYKYEFWRPTTAIPLGDTDGNPDTMADPDWAPLALKNNGGTPAFPAYSSGHATFAGTFSRVMQDYFGNDVAGVEVGTDDPSYTGGLRYYDTFSQMAEEDADSRILLGVHWRFDAVQGLANGDKIGDYVYTHELQPCVPSAVPEPLTVAGVLGAVAAVSWMMRRRARLS